MLIWTVDLALDRSVGIDILVSPLYGGWGVLARQGEARHDAGNQRQDDPCSAHHVKVFLTIGAATSLIERVALKRALTYSAHMMLHVEEGK